MSHLYQPPTIQGSWGRKEVLDGEVAVMWEMPSSGHDMVIAHISSQQLWLLAQDQTVRNPAWEGCSLSLHSCLGICLHLIVTEGWKVTIFLCVGCVWIW